MAKQQTTPEALPLFARFARAIERQVGRSSTFVLAIGIVLVWAASGPLFHWSDTWQLVINTGTTIITFLMVFVIQNTQSRDTMALHLKLDELIRVTAKARDELVGAEDLSDKDIVEAREAVHELAVAEGTALAEAAADKAVQKARAKPRANGRKPGSAGATTPAR